MSMTLLGECFDIHCGGVDNIFPHHENEIAQSEAATGSEFVRVWVHGEHLRTGGEKMAKSLGNFATVDELVAAGVRPSALRYLLIAGAHYRRTVNYTEDSVHAATESVDRFADFSQRVRSHQPQGDTSAAPDPRVAGTRAAFESAMDDDLNLAEAMGAVFSLIRSLNRELDGRGVDAATHRELIELIDEVDDVLGVLHLVGRERAGAALDPESATMLNARESARAARHWAESDRLRDALAERGIAVEDTPAGQRWRRS
jgi:cysteinyl-tRNA synthetase